MPSAERTPIDEIKLNGASFANVIVADELYEQDTFRRTALR